MLVGCKPDVQCRLGDILSCYSVYPEACFQHWIQDNSVVFTDLANGLPPLVGANKGADLILYMLVTLPGLAGEAVFEMKPLSAAFLELACRGLLAQAAEWELYRLTPDVHDACTTTVSPTAACRADDKCEGCSLCRCVACESSYRIDGPAC
jgi:hypothetical protein